MYGRDRAARLEKVLQRMISTSSDEKEDELKLLNEEYRQYKKDYMKHLQYDPETPDLSKIYVFSTHLHLILQLQL